MSDVTIPSFDVLMNPVLQALKQLGGSGTNEEIRDEVADILQLSDAQLEVLRDPHKSGRTVVEERLAWAKSYLKKYGVLENSSRGVWALTSEGSKVSRVDPRRVIRSVQRQRREASEAATEDEGSEADEETWRQQLASVLLNMEPGAFERLIQRMLRESGFVQVEVTGRTGDGGIDGMGIMRLGGLLSFHVLFQCKRWKNPVSASVVRDFRGAMVGRTDKGLIVTTGTFTSDAKREATRDGAPAIDLVDGEQLLDKLKDLSLGVKTEIVQVEKVTIDADWFSGL